MLASMITMPIVFAILFSVSAVAFFVAAVFSGGNHSERSLCIFGGFFSVVMLVIVSWVGAPGILVKEVSTGVFLDRHGRLLREDVPKDVPVIYEIGKPEHSGYTIQWWRWVKIVRLEDKYDWRVAEVNFILHHTEKEALLGNGDIVPLHKNVQTVNIPAQADFWWRKQNPGKVQAEVAFLVIPEDNGDKARIENYVFK